MIALSPFTMANADLELDRSAEKKPSAVESCGDADADADEDDDDR